MFCVRKVDEAHIHMLKRPSLLVSTCRKVYVKIVLAVKHRGVKSHYSTCSSAGEPFSV